MSSAEALTAAVDLLRSEQLDAADEAFATPPRRIARTARRAALPRRAAPRARPGRRRREPDPPRPRRHASQRRRLEQPRQRAAACRPRRRSGRCLRARGHAWQRGRRRARPQQPRRAAPQARPARPQRAGAAPRCRARPGVRRRLVQPVDDADQTRPRARRPRRPQQGRGAVAGRRAVAPGSHPRAVAARRARARRAPAARVAGRAIPTTPWPSTCSPRASATTRPPSAPATVMCSRSSTALQRRSTPSSKRSTTARRRSSSKPCASAVGADSAALDIVDAGCGTGLCGPGLKPWARTLAGCDLSVGMLRRAKARKVYDVLHQAELTHYLNTQPEAFDAVVSADTLCYFGALDGALAAARRSLRSGGWLIFTVEALSSDDERAHVLQTNGRYAHGAAVRRSGAGASAFRCDHDPAANAAPGGWRAGARLAVRL